MTFPTFFDEVPSIVMHDPLAELLGAQSEGRLEYRYVDAVRLAGHSCPTVAGAFVTAMKGLAALYPDRPAERGAVKLEFREAMGEGVTGVVASVIGLVTGAAGEGGFQGLGGRYQRRGLLSFGHSEQAGEVRISTATRAVEVTFNHSLVPFPPGFNAVLGAALRPEASAAERRAFAAMFQNRVREILIARRDDPALVTITEVAR